MIRVGVAGFGKIGKVRVEEINKNPNTELVAIFDLNKSKELDGVLFCNSFDELINLDLDAVFICTYNNVNAEYTTLALERNLHVFCEKPPARSLSELKKVSECYSEKKHLVLKYGFNHRFHYSVIEAKKIIDSGKMGKLLWLRGVYGKAGSIDYDKNWRNYKKYSGGGILIDQGIHMLDLISFFSNKKFEEINSLITTAYWNIESEDNAFVTMRSSDNLIASFHSSATHWKHKFLLEMCFEEGYINLDGILSKTNSYAPEKMIVGRREFEDITFAMGKPKEETVYFSNDDSWKLEVKDFADSIINKCHVKNGTLDDALNVMSLIEKIYKKSI